MSHQSKGMNKHIDCMVRLNGIPELSHIVQDHIKKNSKKLLAVKKRPMLSTDNNDRQGKQAKKRREVPSNSVSVEVSPNNNVAVGESLKLTASSSKDEDAILSGLKEDTSGDVWGRGS
jgi:hypothetical protein